MSRRVGGWRQARSRFRGSGAATQRNFKRATTTAALGVVDLGYGGSDVGDLERVAAVSLRSGVSGLGDADTTVATSAMVHLARRRSKTAWAPSITAAMVWWLGFARMHGS
ncbi:Os03g0197150 [Oryza sativa Japonica Group]|uniref:Os03g0197150 protein n=1 Tax=Oryza sativa subsp. japonica TaxID=39947 RepID=A0A0P0VUE6_ORYSJ|nr:Os03g0197150 [Oryza sativa Japonica Group]